MVCYTSPLPAALPLFSIVRNLPGRVVTVCGVLFVERCYCEMEWTQENVIEFIELYKKRNNMGPKAPNAF